MKGTLPQDNYSILHFSSLPSFNLAIIFDNAQIYDEHSVPSIRYPVHLIPSIEMNMLS